MEQKCAVLREHFEAKFYSDISEYKGLKFLNSFDEGRLPA
jgi:hypothetical protein